MKKFLTLIVCLAVVGGVFAQSADKKYSWGVKAGLNLSDLAGDGVDAKMKAGFYVGVVGEARFSELFAVAPELLFSMQGAGDSDAQINSGYIMLPIMAKFYVIEKLSVDVGPQFGYAVSMRAKSNDISAKMPSDYYNGFDLSIGAGVTYSFWKINASVRYNYGLTNVIKDVTNKNSVIQIGVGYKF